MKILNSEKNSDQNMEFRAEFCRKLENSGRMLRVCSFGQNLFENLEFGQNSLQNLEFWIELCREFGILARILSRIWNFVHNSDKNLEFWVEFWPELVEMAFFFKF